MTSVLRKERRIETPPIHRQEGHGKVEAEPGGLCPQLRNARRWKKAEDTRTASALEPGDVQLPES